MKRFGTTGIEYLTRVWNFYSGCLHQQRGVCPVRNCWAETITERFASHYPDGFEPTIHYEGLRLFHMRKPQRVGVCFMGDLMGWWVEPQAVDETGRLKMVCGEDTLQEAVFKTIRLNSESQFLFLTKNPRGYWAWGEFPDNSWVGATVCSNGMMTHALVGLSKANAKHKWISFEPLMGHIGMSDHMKLSDAGIDWVVIGAQQYPTVYPRIEWVKDIVDSAEKVGIPIFYKNNLEPMLVSSDTNWAFDCMGKLRQELPK